MARVAPMQGHQRILAVSDAERSSSIDRTIERGDFAPWGASKKRGGSRLRRRVGSWQCHAAEKLVYATYFSELYSASKTDLSFMAEVEKCSGGKITFEKDWNQSLMKSAELFPSLRSSAADVINGAPSGFNVREYPLANILLPFTSSKADAVA